VRRMGRCLCSCLCSCLHSCARSECERKDGRLVVVASGPFAALGEQPASPVGVEKASLRASRSGIWPHGITARTFELCNPRCLCALSTDGSGDPVMRDGLSGPETARLPPLKGLHLAASQTSSRMTLSAQQKGKGRLLPQEQIKSARLSSSRSRSPSSASSSQSSSSSSGSESDGGDSSEDEGDDVSQDYLDSLLEKARRNIASKVTQNTAANKGDVLEEDIIGLGDPESEPKYIFLSFPFTLAFISSQKSPLTGPGHFTTILYHDWENT